MGDAQADAKAVAQVAKNWRPTAVDKLKKLPKAARAFVTDKGYRQAASKAMGGAAKQAAKAIGKRAAGVAKEEVHEFKEAGGALKTLAQKRSFKALSGEQKKALATVTKHMAITAAASAAVASGVGIPAAFAKGLGRHFAAKMVSRTAERLHIGAELSHIAQLFQDEGEEAEMDAAMGHVGKIVAEEYAKELEQGIDPEELEQVVAQTPEEQPKETRSPLPRLVHEARLTMR